MNFSIDWSQGSTIRGAIWLLVAILGGFLILDNRSAEIPQLMLLGAGVAGGLGVAIKD